MTIKELLSHFNQHPFTSPLLSELNSDGIVRIILKGLMGSSRALLGGMVYNELKVNHVFILPDKESAAYFYNDLEALFEEKGESYTRKKVLFYPTSYKRHYEPESRDNTDVLSRAEVLDRIGSTSRKSMIVTYPEALSEKVITKKQLTKNTLKLKSGEQINIDFAIDVLNEYEFERSDFVYEPGQFAVRGGIIDVFSFSNDHPYRIEFFGDEIDTIRTFDPATQLSNEKLSRITIIPNIQDDVIAEFRESFLQFIPKSSVLWWDDIQLSIDRIASEYVKAKEVFNGLDTEVSQLSPDKLFSEPEEISKQMLDFKIIEFGNQFLFQKSRRFEYEMSPQPSFNKNFEILFKNLAEQSYHNYTNLILADTARQLERFHAIFEDVKLDEKQRLAIRFATLNLPLHEGFIDHETKLTCYTDHQIFERYHKFNLKRAYKSKEAITIKELYDLKPGDYVTHIDHGIGKFDGLELIDNNGKQQEAIRLIYKNGDLLYVSIHSLHRIAKYVGKDAHIPQLNKLGTNAWNRLKEKTKKRVKDIAKDLIKLYAERKNAKGFQFQPDTYLQHELEASFIYEDTPDQIKSTRDVKADMQKEYPMDRLVCGDVGFGKTEIAVRAAFKAVSDSKQVAILVPTTILALQHYKTFSDRLSDFPCKVDYISRFKSSKQQKQTLADLKAGKIDILVGTHRLISKDVEFKDLGLLIIDEEQRFGVGAKEKLKQIKVNVDTLTLTATPIPRTLQFSLMGARDLSVINTPPPNRYPVQTEIVSFSEEVIREGIMYEISRGGQVFFIHNRVQNIMDVKHMLEKFAPGIKIGVGHGQMEGKELEQIMIDFIEGYYDVLLATTIIESGLDIPNANTIYINDAQNFGLSDLHQLRGRVGRSNKKAFCYLLSPPLSALTNEARARLKAIEEFADLGSGFNVAMRDLDIRGAGNMLGGEQSGFISEIGFEMYHKILDEAILELKETDFREVFADQQQEEPAFVKECQLETDMEVLFPNDYVTNITERLTLYKELDNLEEEEDLLKFQDRMIDRFGPMPKAAIELMNAIRLRWLGKEIGFEKIVMRMGRLSGYFVTNQESPYYQSENFTHILRFVQQNHQHCRMQEKKDKLTISFNNVRSVQKALEVLRPLQLN